MMNTDFSSSSGTTSVEKHIRMPSSGGPSFSAQFDAMFNPENGGKGFPKTPQHLIQFIRQVRYRGDNENQSMFFSRDRDDHGALLEALTTYHQASQFISDTFPFIVQLADRIHSLNLPTNILVKQQVAQCELTQEQCASILANSFLCTWPRLSNARVSMDDTLPGINYDLMFTERPNLGAKVAKLQMLFHYFERVKQQMPTGKFIMQRRVVSRDLAELNNRLLSEKSGLGALSKVQVMAQGSIGDELGTLEADFANMVIGGGSMDYGCVQEEIKFSICPEMNVSRLYCEVMEDNEAIVLIGGEQFAKHKGYAFSLQYDGDYVDTRKDESGNITVQTVAIDAIRFVGSMNQFESGMINRELLKAFAGFYEPSAEAPKTRISTGNWGCGAFNGDKQLKFVIQWIAASLCQRDLVYYTFDKGPLASEIQHFIDSVNGVTVQEMYAALMKLSWICAQNNIQPPDTFNHLLTILGKKGELNTATRCTIQ